MPEDVYIEEPGSLVAQPHAGACQRLGVEVLADEAVTAVLTTGGAVSGLETAARRIETPVVVDAARAWVRQVGALAGARVPVVPVRYEPNDHRAHPPGSRRSALITRVLDHAVDLRPARGGPDDRRVEARPLSVDPGDIEPPGFDTDSVPRRTWVCCAT